MAELLDAVMLAHDLAALCVVVQLQGELVNKKAVTLCITCLYICLFSWDSSLPCVLTSPTNSRRVIEVLFFFNLFSFSLVRMSSDFQTPY